MAPATTTVSRGPIRTCLGCRHKKKQSMLWRFAITESGMVVADFPGRMAGRHAYCCKERDCLERFFKNIKGLARTFRSHVRGFDEELKKLFGSEE